MPMFRGSREALNENLVETILPFRILDLRQTPDPKRTGADVDFAWRFRNGRLEGVIELGTDFESL
jgi:hypothetical protein